MGKEKDGAFRGTKSSHMSRARLGCTFVGGRGPPAALENQCSPVTAMSTGCPPAPVLRYVHTWQLLMPSCSFQPAQKDRNRDLSLYQVVP